MSKTELGFDLVRGRHYIRCPHDLSRMYILNTKERRVHTAPSLTLIFKVQETYQCERNRHRITIDAEDKVISL